jgi:hypothetical protein
VQSRAGQIGSCQNDARPDDGAPIPYQFDALPGMRQFPPMSTLAEIEQAADTLPPEEKQELILFLAARLRADGARMPTPRQFSKEEMAGWIAEDEADMERFRRGA